MSRLPEEALKALQPITPSFEGLGRLKSADAAHVIKWCAKYGDALRAALLDSPKLTTLDRAVLLAGDEAKKPVVVAMTPALALPDQPAELEHQKELARGLLPEENHEDRDMLGRVRAILQHKFAEGLRSFRDKECLVGNRLSFEQLKPLLNKAAYDLTKKLKLRPQEIPEAAHTARSKREVSFDLLDSLNLIPEHLEDDPKEVNERLTRALDHARSLYRELGNALYQDGPSVEEMYRALCPEGVLKLPARNPITDIDNEIAKQSFMDLCLNFHEGIKNRKKLKKKAAERMYHTQVILWLTLTFFQLNLTPSLSKKGIDEALTAEVMGLIEDFGGQNSHEERIHLDGRTEPIRLRRLKKGDQNYRVYAGEDIIKNKRRGASMLKVMRNGTHLAVIADELRGQLVLFDHDSKAFLKGSAPVEDAKGFLEHLAVRRMNLTLTDKDNDELEPGEACIKVKLSNPDKPESFSFPAVKLYGNGLFAEGDGGEIFLVKSAAEKAQLEKAGGYTFHSARFEYRIIPQDSWQKGEYDKHHPSHHTYYRIQQTIELIKLLIRPAENKHIYEYIQVLEAMLKACKEAILAQEALAPSPSSPATEPAAAQG